MRLILISLLIATSLSAQEVPYYFSLSERLLDLEEGHTHKLLEKEDSLNRLRANIAKLLLQDHVNDGFWGVHVESLKTGKVYYSHHSRKFFRPASNTKVFTNSYALEKLGANFTYQTELHQLDFGRYLIKGSGDPTIHNSYQTTGKQLDRFFAWLKSHIETTEEDKITLELDSSIIKSPSLNPYWSYGDFGLCFGVPIAGLQLGRSCEKFIFDTRKGALSIKTSTNLKYSIKLKQDIKITNKLELDAFINPLGNDLLLSGTVPSGRLFDLRIGVPNPVAYFGEVLSHKLSQELGKPVHIKEDFNPKSVKSHISNFSSPPLSVMAIAMMKASDNQFAESFLLSTLTEQSKNRKTKDAIKGLLLYLKENVGINPAGIRLKDGSGVAHYNYVRPTDLVKVLRHNLSDEARRSLFLPTLPIAGVDGTLRNRMRSGYAHRNVKAKTGTLTAVSALSGSVKTRDGEELVFSIMANDYSARTSQVRKVQDAICEYLASYKKD